MELRRSRKTREKGVGRQEIIMVLRFFLLLAVVGCGKAFFTPSGIALRYRSKVQAKEVSGVSAASRGSFCLKAVGSTASNAAALSMEAGFDTKKMAKEAESKMVKSVESMQQNLATLRTGRANPSILDRVQVEYYGTPTPLNQVAGVKTTSATQLMVDPYDKGCLADIERAILESGIGLNPNNDGSVIRLNIPPVTEDRRKELCKEAKSIGEEGKVAIRNIRRDAVDTAKKAEKSKELSQDQSKDATGEIQKLTDKYTKQVDTLVTAKEKDIMTV
ncbi:unnamed protein product [Chrysoparadoxa australica]